MGCFNTVIFKCPVCGSVNRYQSKAGSCSMITYQLQAAPMAEVADIAEESEQGRLSCQSCDCLLLVHTAWTAQVSQNLSQYLGEEDDDA